MRAIVDRESLTSSAIVDRESLPSSAIVDRESLTVRGSEDHSQYVEVKITHSTWKC